MSDIRHTHPGYFSVTLGLALPWYIGLGIGFSLYEHTLSGQESRTYDLISAYVPLQAWGAIYLLLGTTLLISLLSKKVPHIYVRICCGLGLMLTTFWFALYIVALATGRMDLIAVMPAWATVACVEWAAFREPQEGPKGAPRYEL